MGIIKYKYHYKTKRKLPLHAHGEHLHIESYLLAYAMLQKLFKEMSLEFSLT